MQNKLLTIFTPTYNRKKLLPRLYESLINQECKEFIWMIIDDGSIDDTKELVKEWIIENKIEINYFYKENGGMHTAHNLAYKKINTELCMCIDSDDFLPVDSVKIILNNYHLVESKIKRYAGFIGLNSDMNNRVVGKKFDEQFESTTVSGYYHRGGKGDKKLVYRTKVINEYPSYPEFEGERLVPLSFKYLQVDTKYEMLIVNRILCIVDYQEDGSSNTIIKQYFSSPRGFIEARKNVMINSPYLKDKYLAAVHYISGNIIIKNFNFFNDSPNKLITLLALPAGLLLNLYLRYKLVKE